MGIAAYIKEIGRGKEGARPLSEDQAHDLLSQVLDARVTDLEIGAFALAMRIKGETADELKGFMRATHERCMPLPLPGGRGAVVLPSYNGARKLPNLTPLLAGSLARQGACVLVHGVAQDPSRVTTHDIWQALGWPVAHTAESIEAAWHGQQPVFVPIDDLCPALSKLLAVRQTLGLRNSGHTVAKLLRPWGPDVRVAQVINHTHPEYAVSLAEYLQASPDIRAMLMRGTEGEPVADARRQPRLNVFMEGARRPALSLEPHEGTLARLPQLPSRHDADTTAGFVKQVLSGQAPMPDSVATQAACLLTMLN